MWRADELFLLIFEAETVGVSEVAEGLYLPFFSVLVGLGGGLLFLDLVDCLRLRPASDWCIESASCSSWIDSNLILIGETPLPLSLSLLDCWISSVFIYT